MKRTVEYRDLLSFRFLATPALSPDGTRIAYKVSQANPGKDGYDTELWLYDLETDANRRLAASGEVKFFCWDTEGERVFFATGDNSFTRVHAVQTDGGGEGGLFEIPYKATAIEALSEDRFLIKAVFSPDKRDAGNPEGADLMTFDQLPFVSNGKGYIGGQRTGLGIYDPEKRTFTRLTPATLDVERFSLNRDRTAALFVAADFPYDGVKPIENHVYRLDLDSGRCSPLTEGLSCTFGSAVWCGDAEDSIVVTATDHKTYGVNENPKLWLLQDGELSCLTPEMDLSLGHPVVADTSYGCSDREGVIVPGAMGLTFSALLGFKARLCAVGDDGRFNVLTPSVSSVIDYSIVGDRAAYVAYQDLHLPELFILDKGKERRLTSFNDAFFAEHALSQPIHITFKGRGGETLDGWYMRPVGKTGPCPAILNIHGGPKAAFGDIYHHEMQCWAAKGYAVLYCNPRGSDGYGGDFSDIRGRYGDVDYRDLMDFADWCVKKLNFVDAARLGVTGGSYGGYMTNWIITRTNRFRAAVSQRGIANWISKFGGCDIGYYYVEDQHLGTPWRNSEGPWRDSPVAWADQADTPTLFVHSTEDFRCELNQGLQMFAALKANGVEARLCVFEGENHELSRSGKPKNRLARLRVIAEWFETHLRGRG
ncbi:MAG: S9 family peptidase [Synergistaceae bacterium]|nr:S9 family peptidase [Synergistaceae bacterium]